MARESTVTATIPEDKPLPDPFTARPSTSGTELNLRANRQKASAQFQRAARAEQAYRARRQATNARKDVQAAKAYFRESANQLKLGVGCSIRAMKAIPAVVREKREERRERAEVRKREKAAEKKREWEEKAKKDEEGAVGEGEGETHVAAEV